MTPDASLLRLRDGADARRRALRCLKDGGVVALPTDTLYGLCADALDPRAVARVLEIKGRDPGKPLPVLLADGAQAEELLASGQEKALARAAAHWPGPLTAVLQARAELPGGIVGSDGGVGVRVPESDVVRDLARKLGHPLTGTSANPSGAPPPRDADQVLAAFSDFPRGPDLLIDGGPCPVGEPSTVVDLRQDPPRILRPGAVVFR